MVMVCSRPEGQRTRGASKEESPRAPVQPQPSPSTPSASGGAVGEEQGRC